MPQRAISETLLTDPEALLTLMRQDKKNGAAIPLILARDWEELYRQEHIRRCSSLFTAYFDGYRDMMDAVLEPHNLILIGVILTLLVFPAFLFFRSRSDRGLRVRMHGRKMEISASIVQAHAICERLLGRVLLGNNLVNILASVLTTTLFTACSGKALLAAATGGYDGLILVFAEVLPKTYAISQPDKWALVVARPISLIVRLLSPIVSLVQVIVNGVLRFGVDTDFPWTAADEIKGVVCTCRKAACQTRPRPDYGVLELAN